VDGSILLNRWQAAGKLCWHEKISMVRMSGASPVCLVDLVCFVYLVDLVYLVSFAQPKTRQTRQTK
jgi:hypothetical protein